jgi:hypothetical protein
MKIMMKGENLFSTLKRMKLLFLCCGLLILFLVYSGCTNDLDLRMFGTSAIYDLSIQANETITNVTLFIPLPVKDGKPMVGQRILQESDFKKNGFEVSFIRNPPNLDTIKDRLFVPGEDAWFLRISSDKMDKINQYEMRIENIVEVSNPLMFVNTLYPIGNASTFFPKKGFTSQSITKVDSNRTTHLSYSEVQIPHQTVLYADFIANPSGMVEISSNIRYRNEWKEYYDSWVGNSYSEYITWDHTGEAHGWYQARDTLYAARGVYPNLTSPEWKEVIEKANDRQ